LSDYTSSVKVIIVGGGPAGIMAGLTCKRGIPISREQSWDVLILEKAHLGSFASWGNLRITYRWHLPGLQLVRALAREVMQTGILAKENSLVLKVVDKGEAIEVFTERGECFHTDYLVVATGFFPYGYLGNIPRVRVMFSSPELEGRLLASLPSQEIFIYGRNNTTLNKKQILERLLPKSKFFLSTELETGNQIKQVIPEGKEGLTVVFSNLEKTYCNLLLIDYDSFTDDTGITDFLANLPVKRKRGYIPVDEWGRTTHPRVFAAGNITTPVSGALTALNSGFITGLGVFRAIYYDTYNCLPNLFPWLPSYGSHPLLSLKRYASGSLSST